MIRLDCENPTIRLYLPACGNELARACLTRHGFKPVELPAEINPEGTPPGTVRLTIPTPPPCRGVWELKLRTNCCCFTAHVFVDCPAPQFQAEHQPTSDTPMPIPVCCPLTEQPEFDGRAVVLQNPTWLTYADGVAQGVRPGALSHVYRTWRAYDAEGKEMGCAPVTIDDNGLTLDPIQTPVKPTWIRIDP